MFVNLHNHSHYSLLDGMARPLDYVKKAVEQGSPGLALTDHGNLHGAVEFYQYAKKHGINPIIGVEAYMTPTSRFDRTNVSENKRYYHLVLLAKNNRGYENLIQLVTHSFMEGMYYKPRMDWELLQQYGSDIIALSACLGSELANAVLRGRDEEEAVLVIRKHQQLFGSENYFLEIQPHKHPDQVTLNAKLIELSKSLSVPLVATSDAHYVSLEDQEAQEIMLCIQTDAKLSDENRFSMKEADCSLKSFDTMKAFFPENLDALSNTLLINEMCKVDIQTGKNLIPAFEVPSDTTVQDELRRLCYFGVQKRYPFQLSEEDVATLRQIPDYRFTEGEKIEEITGPVFVERFRAGCTSEKVKLLDRLSAAELTLVERLEYELMVIRQMEFEGYFMIVQDFVNWAKDHGIFVGPGRGSAAGSLVSYCLGITNLDPMKYGLLFERFLNPARISMPDIDLDFADTRRDEVINYVREKYGEDRVAQICTFGTMAARQAVKDVGRALGLSFAEMNDFAKLIPERPGMTLAVALEEAPELQDALKKNATYARIYETGKKLEGVVRHVSVHACAVVISPAPLSKFTALQNPPKDKSVVITQLSAKPMEDLGLLKMDFLGLTNLTVIEQALRIIRERHGLDLDINSIPLDDLASYSIFQKGQTTGIFQFESAGMKRYLRDLKPTEFEDIVAMVALYRPGPMELIPSFIRRKHGKETIKYLHPRLEPILGNTYGIGVYQEQMMQIATHLAGFSLSEGDTLRKAIGKKIKSLLDEQEQKLVQGMIAKGIPEPVAREIWELFPPFARYGFNKSHAACYAMIAYQTAYLKAHYPTEFMAALMSSDAENTDRIALEVNEAREMGIEVLPPSVNESQRLFTVVTDGRIRFGLGAIKGLGTSTVEIVLAARGSEPFSSLEDFAKRIDANALNKKSLEALAMAGALDAFAERATVLGNMDVIGEFAKQLQNEAGSGQMGLFSKAADSSYSLSLAPRTPAPLLERLAWERATLGLFVSGHPLDGLRKYVGKKANLVGNFKERDIGSSVTVIGIITTMRKMLTRTKETMLAFTMEDPTGSIDAVIFPKSLKMMVNHPKDSALVKVEGRLDRRNGSLQVTVDRLTLLDLSTMVEKAKNEGFFDPEDKVTHASKDFDTEEKPEAPPAETEAPPAERSEKEEPSEDRSDYEVLIPRWFTKEDYAALRAVLEHHAGKREAVLLIGERLLRTKILVNGSPELQKDIEALFQKDEVAPQVEKLLPVEETST